ncbi:uncharacterized protein [Heterodontus francisci]|uniref:uncharacterized protein n=1 Tax=Heterodontus francisci TaxID=7792 RepID=UPI00355C6BE8
MGDRGAEPRMKTDENSLKNEDVSGESNPTSLIRGDMSTAKRESAIKLQSTRQEADGRKKIEIQEKSCRCLYSVKLFTLSRMKNQFFCMCLTVTLLSAAAQSCSSQCTCAGDLANCKFVSLLQEVLTDLPKSTAMILLQGGSITMIEPRAFQNFSNLWYLSITDFKLSLLSNALTMSTTEESSLQLLDLSNNRLENCRVESSAFAGLQNLTELKLNENSLNVLKPAWFSDLTSLNKLNIKLNNISYLPPRIFATLTQLNQLNAASNLIQYISTDTFYGLSTLNELDLSNNELLFINKDAFRPLQRLSQLLLNDNQLMMLAEVPESVQNLHLQSNPWECSCHLVLLLESRREAIQDPGNLFCQSPENVKGKPVLNLSSSYCSSATLLPATTPLSLTASALQVIPTLSVRAAVYGFIVGFLLAGAICLIICCRKYWREGILRIHAVHSNETKRREGTKRQSEPFVELRASKLEAVSVTASHLIVDGLQNIKDNHEEQRKQHLKVSTESWKNRKRESGENAVKKTEAMRPCKVAPNSLHATDVPHLQNKGVDSVTSMTMECGKAGSWENAEIDRTCSIPLHSPSSNSFGKQKPKLINKSISLPNMKTFISGIQHHTKKRSQDKLICSRTPELVNVKPAPNAKSASMEEWSNMNKEIVHETFGHRLPDVQTCVELEYSSQSKPKCEPQKLMQDGIPCKANLLEEEETTFKPPKSQNEDEENNTLQLLEVNGSLDDKYSQWQQTSPGNFQLSSSVSLQTANRLHVSQVALSGTSHQQASHFSLCAHYCEQPRFNLSHKSTFQQDDEDQSETCQFTSGHKLVAATEFNVFDAIDGEDNTLSAITRENISPPDILEFAHDECKKPEHISPDTQKSATDISEQVLCQMETPVNKDFAFMNETHQSNGNKSELSNSVTTETVLFVGGSAVPVDGGITVDSIITEDEMSEDGTASTSFSWPYAWSMQSQENWNQSTTTFESAPVSEDSETNLSQKVTSKDDTPGQRGTRTVHRQNNLGVEERANRSEAISFQNVSYRNDVSINGESNLELEGHIQSPIMADLEKFSYINNAEIRKDSNLNIDHCGHIPNYSKKIYKSVFKIIDEMRHPVPLDKVQHKMLQNSPALGVEANKALIKTENISIPLSPDKGIESLQQFEASGSAHESSVYSRWFYKSEFGNKFVKRIPTAVLEGDDSNTLPNVQCRNTSRSSAQNQTRSEDEGPADVGAREDAHKPPQFLQLNPPTREELLADDELMLINVLYNLKTALDFE